MQSSLFEFFSVKKPESQPISPSSKKIKAIRTLKKVTKIADDDLDFQLDDELSETDDEEFEKVVTEKKMKKSNAVEKGKEIKQSKTNSKKSSQSPAISQSSSVENLKSISESEIELPDWLTTKLMDGNKRKPSDPDYDPTTVYIPQSAKDKFTPFQAQFWEIKENNFDAVVMIRKGKFYEMFSVDALFARDVLKLKLTSR